MNYGNRADVARVIHDIQQKVCAYGGGRCDCKYGGQNALQPTETGNGCPELRSASNILTVMTEREWAMLVKRAGRPLHAPQPAKAAKRKRR